MNIFRPIPFTVGVSRSVPKVCMSFFFLCVSGCEQYSGMPPQRCLGTELHSLKTVFERVLDPNVV